MEVVILGAKAHPVIKRRTHAGKKLVGEDHVGLRAFEAPRADDELVPGQDGARKTKTCTDVGGEAIFFGYLQAQVEQEWNVEDRTVGFQDARSGDGFNVVGEHSGFHFRRQPVSQAVATPDGKPGAGIERDLGVGGEGLAEKFLEMHVAADGAADIPLNVELIFFSLSSTWKQGEDQGGNADSS